MSRQQVLRHKSGTLMTGMSFAVGGLYEDTVNTFNYWFTLVRYVMTAVSGYIYSTLCLNFMCRHQPCDNE